MVTNLSSAGKVRSPESGDVLASLHSVVPVKIETQAFSIFLVPDKQQFATSGVKRIGALRLLTAKSFALIIGLKDGCFGHKSTGRVTDHVSSNRA